MSQLMNSTDDVILNILYYCNERSTYMLRMTSSKFLNLTESRQGVITFRSALKDKNFNDLLFLKSNGHRIIISHYIQQIIKTKNYEIITNILYIKYHSKLIFHHIDYIFKHCSNDIIISLFTLKRRSNKTKYFMYLLNSGRYDLLMYYNKLYDSCLFTKKGLTFGKWLVILATHTKVLNVDILKFLYDNGLSMTKKRLLYAVSNGTFESVKLIFSMMEKSYFDKCLKYIRHTYICSGSDKNINAFINSTHCNPLDFTIDHEFSDTFTIFLNDVNDKKHNEILYNLGGKYCVEAFFFLIIFPLNKIKKQFMKKYLNKLCTHLEESEVIKILVSHIKDIYMLLKLHKYNRSLFYLILDNINISIINTKCDLDDMEYIFESRDDILINFIVYKCKYTEDNLHSTVVSHGSITHVSNFLPKPTYVLGLTKWAGLNLMYIALLRGNFEIINYLRGLNISFGQNSLFYALCYHRKAVDWILKRKFIIVSDDVKLSSYKKFRNSLGWSRNHNNIF